MIVCVKPGTVGPITLRATSDGLTFASTITVPPHNWDAFETGLGPH